MKTSRYNLYLQDSTGMVIYNAKSDEIVALTPELSEEPQKHEDCNKTVDDGLTKLQHKHKLAH